MTTRVAVIGLGKAGGSLVASLRKARLSIVGKWRRVPRTIPACDVLFVAVPDDALPEVDATIAERVATGPRSAALVAHLSGARGVDALAVTRDAGVRVGTFHPLASLDGRAPIPPGTLIAIDAPSGAMKTRLASIATKIHCVPAHVPSSKRALYHAGAVVSANLAVALLEEGTRLLVKAGVPRALARVSLARLLKSQAENAIARELADALTGPIARGDAGTVARHIAVLTKDAGNRELAAIYRALSRILIDDVTRHPGTKKRELKRALR